MIKREEIIDYITYKEQRPITRPKIIAIKKRRRIHIGNYLTFLFENKDTIRYQIQEMVLAEKIVKEANIQHEIDTYNELFGMEGSLPCVLMIEIDDIEERKEKLALWVDLPGKIYVKLKNGEKIFAKYDERQIDEHKLSSVQYLNFDTAGQAPIALGSDLEELKEEQSLTEDQINALTADIKELTS